MKGKQSFGQVASLITAQEALASMPPPPPPPMYRELTAKEKAEKEARENPTVDENGEHIMTVEEAKVQAKAMQ